MLVRGLQIVGDIGDEFGLEPLGFQLSSTATAMPEPMRFRSALGPEVRAHEFGVHPKSMAVRDGPAALLEFFQVGGGGEQHQADQHIQQNDGHHVAVPEQLVQTEAALHGDAAAAEQHGFPDQGQALEHLAQPGQGWCSSLPSQVHRR